MSAADCVPHVGNRGRTPFSPKWGEGGFSWRCRCGAKSRRNHSSHNAALLAWERHYLRRGPGEIKA